MRRALLIAAALVAVPALVFAAVTAGNGQVIETTNARIPPGTTQTVSYMNAAQCGGGPMHLEWNIPAAGGASITGTYKLFASSRDPATRPSPDTGFCDEVPNTNTSIYANSIGSTPATTALQDLDIAGNTIITAVSATGTDLCNASRETTAFWICAHLVNSSGVRISAAVGKFIMQLQAPNAPANVSAASADSALRVSWTAPTNDVEIDHYIITATPVGATQGVSSGEVTGTSARVGGLTNGVAYNVSVVAFSIGGNESQPGTSATPASPKPMEDFWDWYKRDGGTEQGGCASGPGGVVALAGVALLLALRRRGK